MTNAIKALIVTTLITNWVPVKIDNIDKEIGVIVEQRKAYVGQEVLPMKSRIVNQKLVREPEPSLIIFTNATPIWPGYQFHLKGPLYQTNDLTNLIPRWRSN